MDKTLGPDDIHPAVLTDCMDDIVTVDTNMQEVITGRKISKRLETGQRNTDI